MQCPKCNKEIGQCQKCPFCGYEIKPIAKDVCKKCGKQGGNYFEGMCEECYNKMYENKEENENPDRTIFLRIINAIQVVACIIIAIISFANGEIGSGIMLLIVGFVAFAFVKGFVDIIELLDNINNKLK